MRERGDHRGGIRHVQLERFRSTPRGTNRFDGVNEPVDPTAGDRQSRPGVGERERERTPEAAAGTGHQRDPSLKLERLMHDLSRARIRRFPMAEQGPPDGSE